MRKKVFKIFGVLFTVLLFIGGLKAQDTYQFQVNVKEVKGKVNPNMWGVFFEDINMGADGGLYAELIKNRSFEFYKPLMGWKKEGKGVQEGDVLVLNRLDKKNNPRFLRVSANNASKGAVVLQNEGFRGMGLKQGLSYTFSTLFHQVQPGIKMYLELLDEENNVIGTADLIPEKSGDQWYKQSATIQSSKTVLKGKFQIGFTGTGVIDLDMVSLFPQDTWKNRSGGLRADMVQKLADMKPGFIRFPGGCIVEGHELATRYQWKKTIGPVDERELIVNRWNTEFAHRPAPDYFQSFGLGFFEYFQLSEDIGAEPLPILNCGMACQFNSGEIVPLDELDEYVQDALDLIEFANGDINSKWGKIRNDMGHPQPFNLKMLGVGNENWGPQYVERLKVFQKAIKAKYPEIKLVYSSGTDPEGEKFQLLNTELRRLNVDIIDEHYYRSPEWFTSNANRYDHYDRKGAKIFAGEYAGHVDGKIKGNERNNWQAALAEAAFLTGVERNADVVIMASYAPLFAHVDAWQWAPDLIWVDNLNVYGTPSYYVQKLYSLNKGTDIVSINRNNELVAGKDQFYASATTDATTGELILKIANLSAETRKIEFDIKGIRKLNPSANMISLRANNQTDFNSITNPELVSPKETKVKTKGKKISVELPSTSFTVFRCRFQ